MSDRAEHYNNDFIIDIEQEAKGKNEIKSSNPQQSLVYKLIKTFGIIAVGTMAIFGAVNYYKSSLAE